MKKKLLIIMAIVTIFLTRSPIGNAAELDGWEGYGGLGYNSYNLEEINKFINGEDVDYGLSFYLGIKKELNSKVKAGLEIESMEVDWSNSNYQAGSTGYLGIVEYQVRPGIYAYGGLGLYFVELDGFGIDDRDSNWGAKLGVGGDYQINDRFSLESRVAYRNNSVEVENLEVDFGGLTLNANLVYKF